MQDRFDSTLARLWADGTGGRVLLAVSGGIDSMTMADLFLHSALRPSLAVAHFNFHLRGADSDGDRELDMVEFARTAPKPAQRKPACRC